MREQAGIISIDEVFKESCHGSLNLYTSPGQGSMKDVIDDDKIEYR